jgi:hypothetical protein
MLTKDEARRIAANVAKLPERSRSRKRELALEYVLGCPLPGRAAGKGVLETLSITPWETPAAHSHDRTRPTEFRAADLTSEGKTSSRHNLHVGFTKSRQHYGKIKILMIRGRCRKSTQQLPRPIYPQR